MYFDIDIDIDIYSKREYFILYICIIYNIYQICIKSQ